MMTRNWRRLGAAAVGLAAAACATTIEETGQVETQEIPTPAAQSVAPAPASATEIKTYAPGAQLNWKNQSDDDVSFTETVIHVGEDFVIYRVPEYDPQLEDIPEFYAIFSGVYYADCPEAAIVSQADRKGFVDFWKSPESNQTSVKDVPNSTAYTYEIVSHSTMPTYTTERDVHWLRETSDDGAEPSIYYVAKDDLEVVGWAWAQDDHYRLESVTSPEGPPASQLLDRALAACPIPPLGK